MVQTLAHLQSCNKIYLNLNGARCSRPDPGISWTVRQSGQTGKVCSRRVHNDYMNAEVIRFDGGIRFQPK